MQKRSRMYIKKEQVSRIVHATYIKIKYIAEIDILAGENILNKFNIF